MNVHMETTNGASNSAATNYGATEPTTGKRAVELVTSPTDPSKTEHQLLKPGDKISGKAWGRVKNMFTRKSEYPISVFFIIGNEFCERFSFYGMKTILILYLTLHLNIEANTSTAIYHTFTMLCYFTPLIGALIADSFLGKYKTILYISLIYCVGNVMMALTALPPAERYGPMIGLSLIAFGTGGIKPCVAAFGGDQFTHKQEKQIQGFFSVFYFAINSGSLLSTLVTPILRADVQCFGGDCYAVAFGIPAILMLLSLSIFFAGRNKYKKNPPTGNLFAKVCGCICYSIKQSWVHRKNKDRVQSHWLNFALDKYDPVFVEEVKSLLRVLVMFLPLPLFWALFDQQGSRWTLQAQLMDGSLGKLGILKPDQMQALNPILIILMIPLFESVIYPMMDRMRIPNRPLQRMVTGMIFATTAFMMAGFVQLHLNDRMDIRVPEDQSGLTMINVAPCQITVSSEYYSGDLDSLQSSNYTHNMPGNITVKYSKTCVTDDMAESHIFLEKGQASRLFFYEKDARILIQMADDQTVKPPRGMAAVSFFSMLPKEELEVIKLKSTDTYSVINVTEGAATQFFDIDPAFYEVYNLSSDGEWIDTNHTLEMNSGASYTVVALRHHREKHVFHLKIYPGLTRNSVSMFLQIPQYILITTGEVMFSITGLSFAYSQAPSSMKSVLQASWLLTVAVGNLIVVIVAEAKLVKNQAIEFFLFAALMAADVIIFSMMSMFYRYNDYTALSNADDEVNLVQERTSCMSTPTE